MSDSDFIYTQSFGLDEMKWSQRHRGHRGNAEERLEFGWGHGKSRLKARLSGITQLDCA
jgi:hypothetical protein